MVSALRTDGSDGIRTAKGQGTPAHTNAGALQKEVERKVDYKGAKIGNDKRRGALKDWHKEAGFSTENASPRLVTDCRWETETEAMSGSASAKACPGLKTNCTTVPLFHYHDSCYAPSAGSQPETSQRCYD
jgi:hypothetical protein